MAVPKVFVSYAHESNQHRDDVLAFATFLRTQGVDAMLDVWSADARHDWYAWALREMTTSAYVIVVASPAYRTVGDGTAPADVHRGVQSEATLLRDLVYGDRDTWTPKVLPVLLPGHNLEEIPRFLSPHTTTHFTVAANTTTGAEDLLRVIHRSPGHVPPPILLPPDLPPPILLPPDLPPRPAPTAVVWCRDLPVDITPESIEVHLAPSEHSRPHEPEDMHRAVAAAVPGGLVRLDATGSTAWTETETGDGVAILSGGQRTAWFTPPRQLTRDQLAAAVAQHVALLTEIDLARPSSWIPAIGANSTQFVLPHQKNQDLHPTEIATRLTNKVTKENVRPSPQVTNVVNGNVTGTVIQAGDIQGGLHL